MKKLEYKDLKSRRKAFYSVLKDQMPTIEKKWDNLKNNGISPLQRKVLTH